MHGRSGLIGSIFAMTLLGCFDPAAPERSGPVAPDNALAQAFVPGQTGNIQRVVWDGALPVVEQTLAPMPSIPISTRRRPWSRRRTCRK